MEKINEIEKAKMILRTMSPRQFGENLVEKFIKKIIPEIESKPKGSGGMYDAIRGNDRIEIKASRVYPIDKNKNLYEKIQSENPLKYLSSETNDEFWCNINQVKPQYFENLIIVLFFDNIIYIFDIPKKSIETDDNIGMCDGQHRGNKGNEGQISIRRKDLPHYIKNYLIKSISWEEFITTLK